MHIVALNPDDRLMITQTAALLVAGLTQSWPDMPSALVEVKECIQPGMINYVAVNENGRIVGWIGGRSAYEGNAWELHPLVVHPEYQGQGVGRLLVQEFEAQVDTLGGVTIYLGTDDEDNQTSLANVDVYPNVLEHLANIQNLKRHPFEFYQKVGFTIVGMIPDANGIGKPDILMAKRVSE